MADYYGNNDWRDYLAHYGVKGMKWRKHKYKDKIGDIYEYASGKLGEGGRAIAGAYDKYITGRTAYNDAIKYRNVARKRATVPSITGMNSTLRNSKRSSAAYRSYANSLAGRLAIARKKRLTPEEFDRNKLLSKREQTGKKAATATRTVRNQLNSNLFWSKNLNVVNKASQQVKKHKSSGFTPLGYVGDRTDHMKDFINYKKGNADKAKASRTKKRKR